VVPLVSTPRAELGKRAWPQCTRSIFLVEMCPCLQHVSKKVLRQHPEGPDPTLGHGTSVSHALDAGLLAQRQVGRKWVFKTRGFEEGGAEMGVFSALIRGVFSSHPGFPSVRLLVAHWAAQTPSALWDFGKVPLFSLAFKIWLLAGRACRRALHWGTRLGPGPQRNTAHAVPTLTHMLTWKTTRNTNK